MIASIGRVRLLTGHDDAFLPIANLTVPHLRDYAAAHGHEFVAASNLNAASLNPMWLKIPLIMQALDEGAAFVFWIDSDALIVRFDRDIRDHISAEGDIHVAWHGPSNGRVHLPDFVPHYNTGVMLVRNSAWSREFFARVWAMRTTLNHPWGDQAAILWLLGYRECIGAGEDIVTPERAHVAGLDCAWNSIPGAITVDDPIIHHYAGMDNAYRAKIIAADVATLTERRAAAGLRRTIADQLNMWALDVRLGESTIHKREQEIERLVRTLDDIQSAPRRLLKMLPKAFYRRLIKFRATAG